MLNTVLHDRFDGILGGSNDKLEFHLLEMILYFCRECMECQSLPEFVLFLNHEIVTIFLCHHQTELGTSR